jgi:hypothetical protein
VLELFPVYVALSLWADRFADSSVEVVTDSMAVVGVLNRLYSRDEKFRRLLKPIALTCLNHNIRVTARHRRGANNVGPDLLSRGRLEDFHRRFLAADDTPTAISMALTSLRLDMPV